MSQSYRRIINSWCIYDWANSAFATIIMAAVLPVFYSQVAGVNLSPDPQRARVIATSYWGYTCSIALCLIFFSAPFLGAVADYAGIKKRLLATFCYLGVVFTALLFFVREGDWLLCSLLYIVAMIGFSGSEVFYDSLLRYIARPQDIDYISAKGFALGYIAGGIILALTIIMTQFPSAFFIPNSRMATSISFINVAVWWGIFAIPLLYYVPEPGISHQRDQNSLFAGFVQLIETFKKIRQYGQLIKFLLAFWLYSDGIGTVISMATIYGSEIGLDQSSLIAALLLTQLIGFPATLFLGKISHKIAPKRLIYLGLMVYIFISIWGYFMDTVWEFWFLAFLVGLVQGSVQAFSRSLFSRMIPQEQTSEFFGFYSMSSKFAGIFGPFIFGLVSQLTGSSRWGILSLLFFFVAGLILLSRVKETIAIEYILPAEAGHH